MAKTQQQKRIVIFRAGAIGDIIHCLPAIKRIRAKNLEARIDLIIATKACKELLENYCDYIDNIYLVKRQINQELEPKGVLKSFKEHKVDEFVYLHSNFWKAWIWNFRFVKAQKVLCYKKDISLGARENFALTYEPELKKDLLKDPFKILDYKILNQQAVNPEADKQKDTICIVPGVGSLRPHRAYPLKKWFELINELLAHTSYKIKILGGPDELNLSKEIDKEFSGLIAAKAKRIENLIAKTSLLDIVEIFNSAAHVYSADTGLLHIASALGLESSSVFSISSELRTGPFSPLARTYRSKHCRCKPDMTNSQKTCPYLKDGHAECLWDINFAVPVNAQ